MMEQNRDIRGGRSVQTDGGQQSEGEASKFTLSTETKKPFCLQLALQS